LPVEDNPLQQVGRLIAEERAHTEPHAAVSALFYSCAYKVIPHIPLSQAALPSALRGWTLTMVPAASVMHTSSPAACMNMIAYSTWRAVCAEQYREQCVRISCRRHETNSESSNTRRGSAHAFA
jgi:hypothetical protein